MNRSVIVFFTVILSILCLYYLSFTFVARGVQKDARAFATTASGVDFKKQQKYLDSIFTKPVYSLGFASFTYEEVKKNELALGLDLQGGMHVTLEVSPVEIIKAMAGTNAKDPKFVAAIAKAQEKQKSSQKKFVTLFGEAFKEQNSESALNKYFASASNKEITFQSTDAQVLALLDKEVDGANDRSFEVLRKRIDKFGVTNPNIQKLPASGRIQVELPGVDNPERAKKLLSGVAKLEFWEVYDFNDLGGGLMSLAAYIDEKENGKKTDAKKDTTAKPEVNPFQTKEDSLKKPDKKDTTGVKTDTIKKPTKTKEQLKADSLAKIKADSLKGSAFSRYFTISGRDLFVKLSDTAKLNAIFSRDEVKAMLPTAQFMYDAKGITEKQVKGQDGKIIDNPMFGRIAIYPIKKARDGKALLEGNVVSNSGQDFDEKGQPAVFMEMTPEGARKWAKITKENINKRIAIILDNVIYSAPNINSEITGGKSQISGNFTVEEAQDLGNILKAGKLPAPTRVVESETVGASLGEQSISQGLLSMALGLGLVFIFMVLYYRSGGMVANLALIINVFFILGVLAPLGTALTLPGIAGIVLTIGMAVDANVLIFERIREELRNGMSMRMAINAGYAKALSSIIDANVTTFLTGGILFVFGAGPVKGFAVVLMVGILCSVFTAVFISRLVIEFFAKNPDDIKVRFDAVPAFNGLIAKLFEGNNFDFIGNRKKAYLFSTALIVIGLTIGLIRGFNFGIDFSGGRYYVVEFAKDVPTSDVREAVTPNFEGKGAEIKNFGASNRIKITTAYLITEESEESDKKVETALLKGLEKFKEQAPKVVGNGKVGATIADDIRNASLTSIVLSLVMIFLYILLRFRQWQYSLGAVVALVHDVLMVISLYAIGNLFGLTLEIDQVFIAAILTVIGYSINDTVVVFDRIREVFADHKTDDVKVAINEAINETLSRTVITALTTFIVVLVLLIFGGEVLRGFSYALTIGVLFGTYSSIFIASPIVLDLGVKTALDTTEWKPADEISEEWVEEKEVIEPVADDKANKDKSGDKRTGSKFF